jgi:hypothetical protein
LGWYIHHQGAGHVTRFLAIHRALDAEVVVFSSTPRPLTLDPGTEWILLDRDDTAETSAHAARDPRCSQPDAGGLLHWAPLGHRGHASRLARIAAELAARRFDAFVVDVSVEVTLLVRLLGVAVITIAQPGERTDRPHSIALAAAAAVMAPWPEALYRPAWLDQAADRVHYIGGISRFEGRPRMTEQRAGTALLLAGAGGSSVSEADLRDAIVATPDVTWHVLGRGWREHHAPIPSANPAAAPAFEADSIDANWVDDPFDALCDSEVVVSWAGQNAVADLAASGARAIILPQPRPFGEQAATAGALSAAALAVTRPEWPAAGQWGELLDEARALRPRWSLWQTDGAAARAAHIIVSTAHVSATDAAGERRARS